MRQNEHYNTEPSSNNVNSASERGSPRKLDRAPIIAGIIATSVVVGAGIWGYSKLSIDATPTQDIDRQSEPLHP